MSAHPILSKGAPRELLPAMRHFRLRRFAFAPGPGFGSFGLIYVSLTINRAACARSFSLPMKPRRRPKNSLGIS
jgi:hypothetical protein